MSKTRTWAIAIAIAIAIGACGKGKGAPPTDKVAPATPVAKIDGPSITPTVTSSITFVTPKDPATTTWGEMAFPCYRSAIELQAGNQASQAFYQASPLIEPALRAADIDLDRDVAAIGGWSCGKGPCLYLAVTLRHPDRIPAMLATIPGVTPTAVGPGHWSFEVPGQTGTRSVHVRVLPIQWGAALPTDAWSRDMAKATHVLFFTGLISGADDVDPMTAIADPKTAPARVKDVEGVLADGRGRCFVGSVGPNDFQPGFQLDRARVAMSAAEGEGDPLTRVVDSRRTLDLEVELVLSPAPKDADVERWIAQARAWVANLAEPMRAQFAGQGPAADVYLDMLALVGNKGFAHKLAGKSLVLSWRTDRIEQADVSAVESELERVMGETGAAP